MRRFWRLLNSNNDWQSVIPPLVATTGIILGVIYYQQEFGLVLFYGGLALGFGIKFVYWLLGRPHSKRARYTHGRLDRNLTDVDAHSGPGMDDSAGGGVPHAGGSE